MFGEYYTQVLWLHHIYPSFSPPTPPMRPLKLMTSSLLLLYISHFHPFTCNLLIFLYRWMEFHCIRVPTFQYQSSIKRHTSPNFCDKSITGHGWASICGLGCQVLRVFAKSGTAGPCGRSALSFLRILHMGYLFHLKPLVLSWFISLSFFFLSSWAWILVLPLHIS